MDDYKEDEYKTAQKKDNWIILTSCRTGNTNNGTEIQRNWRISVHEVTKNSCRQGPEKPPVSWKLL